jgi:hypothetical protein
MSVVGITLVVYVHMLLSDEPRKSTGLKHTAARAVIRFWKKLYICVIMYQKEA